MNTMKSAAVVMFLQLAVLALPATAAAQEAAKPQETTPEPWEPKKLGFPIDVSGYLWVDTGYLGRVTAQPGAYDQDANYMQGRFVLAAAYERQFGDYFGKAKVELLGLVNEFSKSSYEPHTLDAYLQVGAKKWDVQVGRFLGWEVY
jgi:hypothetical protein